MADPLTLGVLGGVALSEGIKFLYGQATELLKRRRERKDARAAEQAGVAAPVDPPELAGELRQPLEVDARALDELAPDLLELRRELNDYVDDLKPVDPGDEQLLTTADAVRRILEAVYHQRITFAGEQREPSGPVVRGEVDVTAVAGYAAAVRAKTVTGGTVSGTARAGEVRSGAEIVGVDIDHIGDR